ncbi:DUF4384 domain-containing protein [Bacteroidota bacterium]
MKFKLSIFILLFLFDLTLLAQEKITEIPISKVKGEAIGGKNSTPNDVLNEAINNAKINALVKAGVSENLHSIQQLMVIEHDNDIDELFSSDIFTEISGSVKNIEVIDSLTINKFNEFGNIEVNVYINCSVIKYNTDKDKTFDFWIKGLEKAHYQANDKFKFTIKTSKECYMKTFVINTGNSLSYLLYPNEYEKSYKFNRNTWYTFPDSTLIDSYIFTTDQDIESNRLIIILTKEEIPFTHADIKTTQKNAEGNKELPSFDYHDLVNWIYSIPRDERVMKSYEFVIYK